MRRLGVTRRFEAAIKKTHIVIENSTVGFLNKFFKKKIENNFNLPPPPQEKLAFKKKYFKFVFQFFSIATKMIISRVNILT